MNGDVLEKKRGFDQLPFTDDVFAQSMLRKTHLMFTYTGERIPV